MTAESMDPKTTLNDAHTVFFAAQRTSFRFIRKADQCPVVDVGKSFDTLLRTKLRQLNSKRSWLQKCPMLLELQETIMVWLMDPSILLILLATRILPATRRLQLPLLF